MKLKQLMTALLLTLMAVNAQAYSQCQFGVSKIYLEFNDNATVWVSLTHTYSTNWVAINKNKSITNEANLNRFYSTAMTAYTQNKQLTVRYPEDGLDCASLSRARNDFIGMHISD